MENNGNLAKKLWWFMWAFFVIAFTIIIVLFSMSRSHSWDAENLTAKKEKPSVVLLFPARIVGGVWSTQTGTAKIK